MSRIFEFGEKVKGYDVRVLNEREARAGAGILLIWALISFMNAALLNNYIFMKIFIIGFVVDFAIRVLVNPKFAPTLILGRIFVQNQKVEYTGAPQKKFAWIMGLVIGLIVFSLLVIADLQVPAICAVCFFCIILFFFETAFGICVGCKMYNLFNSKKAKLCPGGVCEVFRKEEIQKVKLKHVIVLLAFIAFIAIVAIFGLGFL